VAESSQALASGLVEVRERADRAEAAISGERQRADGLRERLDQARAETEEARQVLDQIRRA
jgi:hypothetical protein